MSNYKENIMQKVIIHGENVLIPVGEMPAGKPIKTKAYVIGHSESGHNHVLESPTEFEVLGQGDNVWVRLMSPAKVSHTKTFEIHETKTVSPGIYKRIFATEYSPFTKVVQRIFD